jgi:hypothetical protein
MKKKYALTFALIVVIAISLSTFTTTYSNPTGAPSGVSGSPGDGNQTCAQSGCHSGSTASVRPGMIISDIPAEGYIPGQTYTITITIEQAGISRWGFQASAQDPAGAKIGSMVLTNTVQTRLTSSGKYITHTTSGTGGSTGSKTWTFDWIAPNAGTGNFSFYASVMAANNNGGRTGDNVFTDELTVTESLSTGMPLNSTEEIFFTVYPNPIIGESLHIRSNKPETKANSIKLYALSGALVLEYTRTLLGEIGSDLTIPLHNIEPGSYLIVVEHSKGNFVKRLIRP